MVVHHYSNALRTLATELTDLWVEPMDLPFQWHSEPILVQNSGMKRWITLFMATHTGVAANVEIMLPGSFIADYSQKSGLYSEQGFTRSKKEVMLPLIYEWLSSRYHLEQFPALVRYFSGSVEQQKGKRWSFAKMITSLFDEYELYRPDELKERLTSGKDDWQTALWRHLHQGRAYEFRYQVMNDLRMQLHEKIVNQEIEVPKRIHIFGISTLAPIFTQIVTQLSESIEVHWYHFIAGNPDAGLWNQPLIREYGQQWKEFQRLLADSMPPKTTVQIQASFESSDEKTVLQLLKQTWMGAETSSLWPIDASVSIHSCHSVQRQAEVLRDHLLDLFSQGALPDTILIMTTDIHHSGPIIKGVLEASQQETGVSFPIMMTDRLMLSEDPGMFTFQHFVELCLQRVTVSRVLDFLTLEPVRTHFTLSDREIDRLRFWFEESRFKWGLDAHDRGQEEVRSDDLYTFKWCIDQLSLGFFYASEERCIDTTPLTFDFDSEQDERLFSLLEHLYSSLHELKKDAQTSLPLREWIDKFNGQGMFFIPQKTGLKVAQTLQSMVDLLALENVEAPVTLSEAADYILTFLQDKSSGRGFLAGGVTLSAMVPMRSIPFDHIALVGMDEPSFPSQTKHPTLSWIRNEPRIGDRNKASDDGTLFLETLLSAQKSLFVSYNGQSRKDTSTLPPSPVVSDLITVLEEKTGRSAQDWITHHPMHAYDVQNFTLHKSYYQEAWKAAHTPSSTQGETRDTEMSVVFPLSFSFSEWGRFWKYPIKYITQQWYGIRFEQDANVMEDEEPEQTKGLSEYHIAQTLSAALLTGQDGEAHKRFFSKRSTLPLGYQGEAWFDEEWKQLETFVQEYFLSLSIEKRSIQMESDIVCVHGEVFIQDKNTYVELSIGSDKLSTLFIAWMNGILIQTMDPELTHSSILIYKKRDSSRIDLELPSPSEQAWSYVEESVRHFSQFAQACVLETVLKEAQAQWKHKETFEDFEFSDSIFHHPYASPEYLEQASIPRRSPTDCPSFMQLLSKFFTLNIQVL